MKICQPFRHFCLLLLLMGVSLASCKKEHDSIAPDAASAVAGKYTYSELSYGGKTLPADQTDLKGTLSLVRQTASQITFKIDVRIKSSNEEFLVENVEDVEVAELGNGAYGLRYEGEEFAQVKGNKVSIKGVDEDNVKFTISATK